MTAKKYRILLIFFFRIIKAIRMPKLVSISQISSKFCHFLEFSSFFFFCLMWLEMFYEFFEELEPIAKISVKEVIFCWISGLNKVKIDQKFSDNSYIMSEIMQYLIVLWNKNHWKADKIVFLLIYIFIYFWEFLF